MYRYVRTVESLATSILTSLSRSCDPNITPTAANSKAKASTNAFVQRINVIKEKLTKTEDQSWPSDVEKIFKITTRSKSSSKPDHKSSTKRKKSSKKKSVGEFADPKATLTLVNK
ncbi:hypothetical protein O6H91_02G143000 [Diphasiastrum complanatum]|uniref:Uncharacterized protein n=1 Tax=Diphasiastrum complanatum TaxID=34168 RepID=A0ACC2ELT6_DIPCM|nr:hypothetical protein O6H91_02G143000 [Diphasiastrum complanatum]